MMDLLILVSLGVWIATIPSLTVGADPTEEGWTVISDESGVKVLTKPTENALVVAVRGISTLPFAVRDIYNVLQDNDRAPEWIGMVQMKKIIRKVSSSERIEYALIHMPWPLQDRYTVASARLTILPDDTHVIAYETVPGEYNDPDRVRAEIPLSMFYLRPISPQSTYVDVSLLSDPKGDVPKFIVNSFQAGWPRDFLAGLKKQTQKMVSERTKPPEIYSTPGAEKIAH